MSSLDRAAQFSSFAALTGYEDMIEEGAREVGNYEELSETEMEILNQKINLINDVLENGHHPILQFTYFLTDAEILRAYIVLVLAVSQQALSQKTASPKPLMSDNPRYTFRCWLIRMGLNGEEFQRVRKILLERMEGTIAWRHPEQLIAAREKIREERRALREHPD